MNIKQTKNKTYKNILNKNKGNQRKLTKHKANIKIKENRTIKQKSKK